MNKTASESTECKIVKRIYGKGRGSVIFQSDFAVCGSPSAIKSAFHRMYSEGILVRLAHGIYYYPKIDTELGLGILYPSIDEIAKAIAKRDKAKIVPTGAYALNRLGLSTQIPMNVVFLTSGTPRRVNVGNGHGILFKHSSSGKNFNYRSELMMLIVTAMREIDMAIDAEGTALRIIPDLRKQRRCRISSSYASFVVEFSGLHGNSNH